MASANSASQSSSVMAWLTTPFSEEQDAWHWILFLGFAVIVVAFWCFVLRQIVEAV